jgi:hypothetical protein
MRIRLLVVTLLASVGGLWASAPADAVQTTTWGMTAAPSGHTARTSLSHPANGATVHDAVIVYNRTAQPITIRLYVLNTTYSNGSYEFGPPTAGLAAETSLGANTVTLAPYQQDRVPVTIRMPRGVKATTLASIGAEAGAVNDGSVSIEQQLVVLIKANPTSHVLPIVGKHPVLWGTGALGVLLGVALLVERERRRTRATRRRPVVGHPLPSAGT